MENNDSMYSYDANILLTKISNIKELDAMFLLEECHRFWSNGGKNLEEFYKEV